MAVYFVERYENKKDSSFEESFFMKNE